MYKLAIDVGGTHTDGVLLDYDLETHAVRVLAHVKVLTSDLGVTQSVIKVVDEVLEQAERHHKILLDSINVHLGTTHFVNALEQRNGLEKVAVVRLALPASDLVPPFFSWKQGEGSLLNTIYGYSAIVHGGSEMDGKVISKLSIAELKAVAADIKALDIKQVVLSAPFSVTHPEMELAAQKQLQSMFPQNVSISLSQSFPQGGILQRENAAALNASLRGKAKTVFADITKKLQERGLTAPVLVTRNDGSFMSVKQAEDKPFLAYSSGPINSIRGAGMLVPFEDALVVDIGGTTTDVGLLKSNSPYMTNLNKTEEGVEFVVDCAHQNSIVLGGGTVIKTTLHGVKFVGADAEEDLPFYLGGTLFTLTDLALVRGRLYIEGVDKDELQRRVLKKFTSIDVRKADDLLHQRTACVIDEIRISDEALPIVLCGGGARLIDPEKLAKQLRFPSKEIVIPDYAGVANAVGASGATIRVRHSVNFSGMGEAEKKGSIDIAKGKAIACGALPESISIVSASVQEYSYSGGHKKYSVVVEGTLHRSVDEERIRLHELADDAHELADGDLELIQKQPYEKAPLQADPIRSTVSSAPDVQDKKNIHVLTEDELKYFAIGAGYLGSGGGGDAAVAYQVAHSAMRNGDRIRMVRHLKQFANDDYVIAVAFAGMPEVINEKVASSLLGPIVVKKMKEHLEIKLGDTVNIVAAVPIEVGGANGLLSAALVATEKLPILDGDMMGRAFPDISMTSAHIDGKFDQHTMVLVKENEAGDCVVVEEETLEACQKKLTENLIGSGGAIFIAAFPMTVEKAKACCIPGTISSAIEIGRRVSENLESKKPIADALNEALKGTSYRECKLLIEGTIMRVDRNSKATHHFGEVLVADNLGRHSKIYYKNENLVATLNNQVVAKTPNIITMVNLDTGLAIGSSADYHEGLRVVVIEIGCPGYFLNARGGLREAAEPILMNEEVLSLIRDARVDCLKGAGDSYRVGVFNRPCSRMEEEESQSLKRAAEDGRRYSSSI